MPAPTPPPPAPLEKPTAKFDDTALLLFSERMAAVPGGENAKSWSASTARGLLELIAAQKGVADDADVCLLRDVKTAFKSAGIARIEPREKIIRQMQEFLTPKAKPKAEDRSHLSKEFLKAAQAGALVEMELMLKAHPSVLAARSTSKGYTPMHYAAMAGALPVLDWLTSSGLSPGTLSSPSDGSAALTPAQVADEYKREAAVGRLRNLGDGFKFLKAANVEDDDARLRVAARAGNAAAVSMLLRREPGLACRPAALAPTGALFAAASGGHTSVLRELIRCGGVDAVKDGPSALQAAIAAQQAEVANMLHLHDRACSPLQVGHWVRLPAHLKPKEPPPMPALGALVLDAKLSRGRSVLVEAYDLQLASAVGAPSMERSMLRWVENSLGLPVWVPVDMHLYLQVSDSRSASRVPIGHPTATRLPPNLPPVGHPITTPDCEPIASESPPDRLPDPAGCPSACPPLRACSSTKPCASPSTACTRTSSASSSRTSPRRERTRCNASHRSCRTCPSPPTRRASAARRWRPCSARS